MIKLENIVKKFGTKEVLSGLSFEVQKGEVFAFLGPNGAGKTTTIKILAGLISQTSGRAYIGGLDISRRAIEAKRLTGYIPDQPFLYPKLKGYEYLDFILDIYKLSKQKYMGGINRLLELFDLKNDIGGLIESYSQGMRQKLVIAGVFLRNPEVIIMDEPMVGLDPKSARVLKRLISEYSTGGTTFFISTHTLEIAEKLATVIAIIKAGRLILLENKQNLLYQKLNNKNLEELFLELTGGLEAAEVIRNL